MKVITLIFTGVRGSYVTGPNGNSIFLPFAGGRTDGDLLSEGSRGLFWSGTYNDDGFLHAVVLFCSEGYGTWDDDVCYRSAGLSIRPVKEK